MLIENIDELNKLFGFSDELHQISFKNGKGNIPLVEIKNKKANALISLQGAHLLNYIAKNNNDLIWVSEEAKYEQGKSIRGGIPICWPWFGAHQNNASYPAHGFARTLLWKVKSVRHITEEKTQIIFELKTQTLDDKIQTMWPTPTVVEYKITISSTLKLELTTTNQGNKNITISEALHTYFNVADITKVQIIGLNNMTYLDKPDDFKRKQQDGNVLIKNEIDRVYINTKNEIIIDNQARKIIIKKDNSLSTIVWNPGKDVADKMGDLGESGYLKMLCVESGNVADNAIVILPGQQHVLQVEYELQSY